METKPPTKPSDLRRHSPCSDKMLAGTTSVGKVSANLGTPEKLDRLHMTSYSRILGSAEGRWKKSSWGKKWHQFENGTSPRPKISAPL